MSSNFDDLQGAVAQFGAGNKVILDDIGMPSIMVAVNKMQYSDLITGGSNETIPFFIVDGAERNTIWVSKFQNIVENDRAYSLAMKLPRNFITFDNALAACRRKGAGWHLNQSGIFAVINLLSQKLGTPPRGNTNFGRSHSHPHEKGIMPPGEADRTLTGSGEKTWYHNHDTSGIADICGNVWEWTGGLRIMNGEIQIIPNGDSMKHDCDMTANSPLWMAILPTGALVAPGTAGTLKVDVVSGAVRINTTITTANSGSINTIFRDVAAVNGVSIPHILIALGLFKEDSAVYGTERFWVNTGGERLPLRGSGRDNASSSGPSAVALHHVRSGSNVYLGFRSAFYE